MNAPAKVHFVDLDGTLAVFDGWKGMDHIGDPVPEMASKVRSWLDAGDRVVIFTARACKWSDFPWATPDPLPIQDCDRPAAIERVQQWTEQHFGQRLDVTGAKGPWDHCYDDSIHQVVRNTGKTVKEAVLERINEMRNKRSSWTLSEGGEHHPITVGRTLDELAAFIEKI